MWAIFKCKPLMSFRKYHHLVLHSMFVKCYHLMNRKPILIHSSLSSLVFVYGSLTVKQFTSSMMCEFGWLFISNSILLKLNRNFKNMMPLKQAVKEIYFKVIYSSESYSRKLLLSSTEFLNTIWNSYFNQ